MITAIGEKVRKTWKCIYSLQMFLLSRLSVCISNIILQELKWLVLNLCCPVPVQYQGVYDLDFVNFFVLEKYWDGQPLLFFPLTPSTIKAFCVQPRTLSYPVSVFAFIAFLCRRKYFLLLLEFPPGSTQQTLHCSLRSSFDPSLYFCSHFFPQEGGVIERVHEISKVLSMHDGGLFPPLFCRLTCYWDSHILGFPALVQPVMRKPVVPQKCLFLRNFIRKLGCDNSSSHSLQISFIHRTQVSLISSYLSSRLVLSIKTHWIITLIRSLSICKWASKWLKISFKVTQI